MRSLFYCHLPERRLADANGGAVRLPKLVAGERVRFGLRFLDNLGSGLVERYEIEPSAWRVAMGWRDARPKTGMMKLRFGGGPWSAAFAMADAGADVVEDALAGIAVTGAKAQEVPGGWMVWRADGAQIVGLEGRAEKQIDPAALVRVDGRDRGAENGGWIYEVRPQLAPVAFSGLVERVLPAQPWMEEIQNGGSDNSNTFFWNEIQALHVPVDFRGAYQFRRGYAKSDVLDTLAGPEEIKAALDKMLADEEGSVSVRTVDEDGVLHIEFEGELGGVPLDLLEVVVYSAPPGDYVIDLDLDTAEMRAALRAAGGRDVKFQLEVEGYVPVDPVNAPAGEKRWTKFFSEEVTVMAPVSWEGLSAESAIDWLRPRPRDYVPYSTSQVLTGLQQAVVTTVGDGAQTQFEIEHGFGNPAEGVPLVTVRVNAEGGRALRPDEYGITYETGAVTIDFAAGANAYGAPASGELAVAVASIGPSAAFQAHTHTIEQITNLAALLDDLAQRLAKLEALVPKAGALGMGGVPAEFTLPDVGEVLADISALEQAVTLASEIVVVDKHKQVPPEGTNAAEEEKKIEEEKKAAEKDADVLPISVVYRAVLPAVGKGATPAKPPVMDNEGKAVIPGEDGKEAEPALWPVRTEAMQAAGKWPILVAAVEAASATDVTALPVMAAGTVWRYTGAGELLLPGGGGRKSQKVPQNGYFAGDGRSYYRVVREGSTNLWHPLEMERELWRVTLGEEQFPDGAELSVSGELRLWLVGEPFDDDARAINRVDLAGQYLLRAEAVPLAGARYVGAASAAVTLGETRVPMSPAMESFRWQLRVRRAGASCQPTWTAYRKAGDGASFAVPACVRLRLVAFDVDDASAGTARGQVACVLPSSTLQIEMV